MVFPKTETYSYTFWPHIHKDERFYIKTVGEILIDPFKIDASGIDA
jgi:hypothetical protein